jgi:hypothetical protein
LIRDRQKFGKDLNSNSHLCFRALRPFQNNSSYESTSTYHQTKENQGFDESKHTYTFVCMSGKDHLEELKITEQKGENRYLTKAFIHFYCLLVTSLLLPFVPLFAVWLWPKSSEISPSEAEQEVEIFTNSSSVKSSNIPTNDNQSKEINKMVYIHLDDSIPIIIFGIISKLFTTKIKIVPGKIHDFVSWFRRFFLIAIISTHALIMMGILDRCFYHERIETMMRVMEVNFTIRWIKD